MKTETVKTIVKVTGILSIVGAALIVILFPLSIAVASSAVSTGGDFSSNFSSSLQAGMQNPMLNAMKVVIGLIGIATFVLGIIFLSQAKKVNQKVTAGVLVIIAGVFSWLITLVSLVLWIIAAALFLRMKFEVTEDSDSSDSIIQ